MALALKDMPTAGLILGNKSDGFVKSGDTP